NFTDLPKFWKFEIDWRVTAFALAVSAASALIFGLLPALHGSRVDLNSALKDSGGGWGTPLRHNRTPAALVVIELSLAVILLTCSSLLIRSFIALHKVNRGFDSTNVLVLYTSFSGPNYANTATKAAVIRNGLERVRAVPGVTTAGSAAFV